tara:strand:- start:34 stop:561 length:528 start_codon:yes stop_codon:yes gene_type:complete
MHNRIPKKFYFIDKFDKSTIDKQSKNTAIIYRNYSKKLKKEEIKNLKYYCRIKGLKFFLSNNVKLAITLNLDGVYLPSFNTNLKHLSFNLKKKFIILGSAHNIKQIKIKEFQKVEAIFISSIFKEKKNFLGINKFKIISKYSNKKIIALGGISKKNLKLLKLINCYGFAGISYFK